MIPSPKDTPAEESEKCSLCGTKLRRVSPYEGGGLYCPRLDCPPMPEDTPPPVETLTGSVLFAELYKFAGRLDMVTQTREHRDFVRRAYYELAAPASSPEREIATEDWSDGWGGEGGKASPTQPRLSQDDEELATWANKLREPRCLTPHELNDLRWGAAKAIERAAARIQSLSAKNRHLKQALAQAGDNIELQEAEQRGYARAVAQLSSCREENERSSQSCRSELTALQPKGEG